LVKARRERERDLEIHEAQIERLRGRLTELKTNKEYQAHLFEIEMANKRKGEFEEQILSLMEQIEAKQQETKLAQARAADAERQFVQEKRRLEALAATLQVELVQLEQKRKELAAVLDQALLERYAKLKAMRKDVAVAPVRGGICYGCRLQLPPQLVAEVKRSDALQTCTYCHRILYWEGELPVPTPFSLPSEQDLDLQETT
jgi:predicted  nucleic acid-binding Zn-ribbon protein